MTSVVIAEQKCHNPLLPIVLKFVCENCYCHTSTPINQCIAKLYVFLHYVKAKLLKALKDDHHASCKINSILQCILLRNALKHSDYDLSDFKRDVIHLFYMQKEMEEVPIFLIYDKSHL